MVWRSTIIRGDQEFINTLREMSNGTASEPLEVRLHRYAKIYEQMRRELGHSD